MYLDYATQESKYILRVGSAARLVGFFSDDDGAPTSSPPLPPEARPRNGLPIFPNRYQNHSTQTNLGLADVWDYKLAGRNWDWGS